jgi:hypothetical protein
MNVLFQMANFNIRHSELILRRTAHIQPNWLVHLVQSKNLTNRPHLCWSDQVRMSHSDGMQRPLKLLLPELQKTLQFRKIGKTVVVLPDIRLEQPWVIRPPIKNPRRGQAIAGKLALKVLRDHGLPRHPDSESSRSDTDSQA